MASGTAESARDETCGTWIKTLMSPVTAEGFFPEKNRRKTRR